MKVGAQQDFHSLVGRALLWVSPCAFIKSFVSERLLNVFNPFKGSSTTSSVLPAATTRSTCIELCSWPPTTTSTQTTTTTKRRKWNKIINENNENKIPFFPVSDNSSRFGRQKHLDNWRSHLQSGRFWICTWYYYLKDIRTKKWRKIADKVTWINEKKKISNIKFIVFFCYSSSSFSSILLCDAWFVFAQCSFFFVPCSIVHKFIVPIWIINQQL